MDKQWGSGTLVHVNWPEKDMDFDGVVISQTGDIVTVNDDYGQPIDVPERCVFQRNPAPEQITAPPNYFVPGDRVDVLNAAGTFVLWADVEVLAAYLDSNPQLNWYEVEIFGATEPNRFPQSRLRRTQTPFT